MRFCKKLKGNKGITGVDFVVAAAIIILLSGTIANMFYQIYLNINLIRLNAMAVNYAVNVLEYTDEIPYEEVNNELITVINEKYDFPENFKVSLAVENYNGNDPEKLDIIKILTVKITYSLRGNSEDYSIKKLKIKEL